MYLREMGTVPLLTREGEVEIAKRIERGKRAVIKSISRTPTVARKVIEMGDRLKAGERTIRELVIFNDEEITDERIDERTREVLHQIDAVRKARVSYEKYVAKLDATPKKDKRKYRRARWKTLRGRVAVSQMIRAIEFTELGQAPADRGHQGVGRAGAAAPARGGHASSACSTRRRRRRSSRRTTGRRPPSGRRRSRPR